VKARERRQGNNPPTSGRGENQRKLPKNRKGFFSGVVKTSGGQPRKR